jgi:outer membrane protein assembly factor BamB
MRRTRSPLITLTNGVQMPALGLGVFQSPPEQTAGAVESAITHGYRLIDTAGAYLNEHQVGEGLRRSQVPRDDVFLETKVWISDYGYDATLHAFDKSAGKLGVDRIDLLLLHQPLASRFDLTLEAYRALETLLADGKVRAIGGSNFMADHLRRLLADRRDYLLLWRRQERIRRSDAVDGELVYTVGPMGDLYAISTKTRKPVWHKNIWKDFGGGAKLPRWAIVQNPLIYSDLLIVAPQTSEAGVVAYDKLTGALKWKSAALSGIRGYVTPSIVKVVGEDHLVMITGALGRGRTARDGSVNGLDPRSGKVLWTYTNWQCIIPVPQALDAGQDRVLITGAYGAGTVMLKVEKKGDSTFAVSELFKNPDFGAHTQPPVLHDGHFYSHYTINERSDGLVAMSMDGQVKWKTDQQPPFVRGGSILADGLMLMTDGNTKLYLIEPSPAGFKPLASAVILEPGDNWAPLALVDGRLLVRGQKELKALQVAQ